jgi:outer membrane biosynthesis protein TonB
MNLTCSYCQTPFTLGMAQKVAALQRMHAENLHHYDAHCPRCGRANAVSRERLEMFTPGWQETIKPAASEPAPASPVSAPEASQSPMPEKQAPSAPAKKPAAKKPVKPAPKKAVKAKPAPERAAEKPAAKKKTKRK